jgi:hypothetical protein
MPIPGKEPLLTIDANWIFGHDQALSSSRIEGKRLDLRWDGPLVNYLGEKFGASAAMSVELRDGRAFPVGVRGLSRFSPGGSSP